MWIWAGLFTPCSLKPSAAAAVDTAFLASGVPNGDSAGVPPGVSAGVSEAGAVSYSSPSSPGAKVMMEQNPSEEETKRISPVGDLGRKLLDRVFKNQSFIVNSPLP